VFSLAALLFQLACSDDEVAPCEIQQLDISLTGTVDDLENAPVPLALQSQYTEDILSPGAFEFLAQVLGHNAPTGSGATAVFGVTGTPISSGLTIQLAGSRIDGSVLDVLGVMSANLEPGQGPSFSAIPRNALLLFFGNDEYIATEAEGNLTVTQVAPLEGTLHAEFHDGAGRHRVIDGQLVVTRTGPGC
jgi:hypothetical protein